MKSILLSTLLVVSLSLSAQLPLAGGPDTFGYTYSSSLNPNGPTYNWFDISTIGVRVTGLADDNFVGPYTLSGFSYYGNSPTQFWIGSNGYIAFNAVNIASTAASFPAIPTIGGPNDFIAPFLSDLTLAGASNPGRVYLYDQGDTVCISYVGVPFWYNNPNQYLGDNSFQVILNRADSSITYNYQKQIGAPDPVYRNNYISIGIENSTGNDGLQFYRGDSIAAITFQSVKFDYPTVIQPLTDISIEWLDNDQKGAKFITQQTGINPVAMIKNKGNQDVNTNISLSYLIEDSTNSIVGLGTASLPSLSAGEDTILSLGNNYSPSGYGRYTLRTYLNGVANDAVQANDTSMVFYRVVDTTQIPHELNYSSVPQFVGAIGWSGGNGGVACYYEPPYYPARVVSANYYITAANAPSIGFYSMLYDDRARGGINGPLLDSVFVPNINILTGQYNTISLNSPHVIMSGGVYLHWLMGGDGISLGTTTANPASNRTYEVLFGAWSPYRSAATQDFLMGINIEPLSISLREANTINASSVYPNPSNNLINIKLNSDQLNVNEFRLIDIKGQQVETKIMLDGNVMKVYKGLLPSGIYYLNYRGTNTKLVFID